MLLLPLVMRALVLHQTPPIFRLCCLYLLRRETSTQNNRLRNHAVPSETTRHYQAPKAGSCTDCTDSSCAPGPDSADASAQREETISSHLPQKTQRSSTVGTSNPFPSSP